MIEEWRAIPGWEGFYEVSDQGRVRSLDRWLVFTSRGKTVRRLQPGRLSKLSADSSGYLQVGLNDRPRHRRALVHQLVLEVFGPPRPSPAHDGEHDNGVRSDNRLSNLSWRTKSHNNRNRHAILNQTGFIGVGRNRRSRPNPFVATARDAKGAKYFIGSFPTAEAASAAYIEYRDTLLGRTND